MSNTFKNNINKVLYYYVFQTPRKCTYEITDRLLVLVMQDFHCNNSPYYIAEVANNFAITCYAVGKTPEKAIKSLIYRLVDTLEDGDEQVEHNHAGAVLIEECKAIRGLIHCKAKLEEKGEK